MESIQLIKNRIQSIGNTRQITQSMRLVSTAKVQKARNRMQENRLFVDEAQRLVRIAQASLKGSRHPYLVGRPVERSAVIVISSDRGLCGGYAANVGKEALYLMGRIGEAKIITVGAKARDYCRRRRGGAIAHSFTGISENPFFEDAREVSTMALDWFDRGEVDQIYVVYTEFHSMLTLTPKAVKLLPLESDQSDGAGTRAVRCEPGDEAFLSRFIPFYMTTFLHGAILESSVCEQSARITSMDSAVRNSTEIIDSLTLLYNQARQGAITQEIIEIVGGAGAVK